MPALSGSTNFPSSLDSHTGGDPLGFAQVNNLAATLTSTSHTNSVTTITVVSTSAFESRGYIKVKREIISYTGKTSTTFTGCTRAADGTSAAAYLAGTVVEQVVVAANHNDLAAGLVAVETAMGARLRYLTRRNRVINGCMRLKQRVTMPTTDDSYCLDRWTLLLEAANAAVVTQETSDVPTDGSPRALKLTVGSGEDNKFGIATYLETLDVRDLRGKTVSLQAKLKTTAAITDVRMAVLEWTGTADSVTSDVVGTWGSAGTNPTLATSWAYLGTPANLSVTTSWATYRVEGLTVGASANNLAVFIWCEDETTTVTTDYLLITDVQLEEGPTCSGMERRHMAVETLLCQRYFEAVSVDSATDPVATAKAYSTTKATAIVRYGAKRTSTTVTISAATDFQFTDAGGSGLTLSALSAITTSKDAAWLDGTVASGLVSGYASDLLSVNGNARIFVDAEL